MNEALLRIVVRCPPSLVEPVRGALFLAGLQSFEEVLELENPAAPQAAFCWYSSPEEAQEIQRALEENNVLYPQLKITFEVFHDTEWLTAWQAEWKPQAIGRRLFIQPSWITEPPPPDRTVLRLDPGLAFGTGTHPTTRLCLELLEDDIQTNQPKHLLDVGCGTGILAIGALLLGVFEAVLVDNEEQALAASATNAEANGVGERITLHSSLNSVDGQFELICANILGPVLDALWDNLQARLAPGGRLIISGILHEELVRFAERPPLETLRTVSDEEWAAVLYRAAK